MDYFDLAEDLDFVAWDNYPGGDWHADRDPGMAHDAMRGIKQRNFWVMEEQSGIPGWERMGVRPAPGQIRMWAWQAIAHGADAVLFFRWRSCLFGTEQFWHGILNHDGVPRRRYREIAGFAQEAALLGPMLEGTEPHHEAAILNSYEQNWALQIQPQSDGLGWWEQTRHFYAALSRRGIGADIIPITVDLSKYTVVFVPSWYLITSADAERFADYVRNGGTLVLNPRAGVKDAINRCRTEPLPALLFDVAGVEVDDYTPIHDGEWQVLWEDGRDFSACVWAEFLVSRGAQPIAIWERAMFPGEPAVTRNAYGKGVCYYLGALGGPEAYDTLLEHIIDATSLTPFEGTPPGVDIQIRRKGDERYLFVINQTAEEQYVPLPGVQDTLLGPAAQGTVALAPFDLGVFRM
jgi:beta-galactosidase